MTEKVYLGDGVYAEEDSGMIKLTTSDGTEVQNTIYLESSVYASLELFARRVWISAPDQPTEHKS